MKKYIEYMEYIVDI